MPNVILKNKKGVPIEYSNVDTVVLPGNNPVPYNSLPAVTSTDNGKVLGVVEGQWNKMDIGPGISYQVVNQLPQTGEVGVIYLVPIEGSTNDVYDEYLWVNNAFEKIGTTEIHDNAVCFTFDAWSDPGTGECFATNFSMSGQEILNALADGKFVYGMSSGYIGGQWINSDYIEGSYAVFTTISWNSESLSNFSYRLTVTANTITSSEVSFWGEDLQGAPGEPGQDGRDGQDGQDGQNGEPGSIELNLSFDMSFDITGVVYEGASVSFEDVLGIIALQAPIPVLVGNINNTAVAFFTYTNGVVEDADGTPIGKLVFRCDSVDKTGMVALVNSVLPGKFPADTISLDLVWERAYDSDTDAYVETLSWSPIRPRYALSVVTLPINYPVINYTILTIFQSWMTSAIQSPGTMVSASDTNVDASSLINDGYDRLNSGHVVGMVISDGTSAWQMIMTGGGLDATTGEVYSVSGKLIADYTVSGVGDFLLDVNLVIKSSEIVIYGYAISK